MRNFALQKKLILGGLAILLVSDATFGYLSVRLSGSRETRQQALNTQALQIGLVKSDVARAKQIQKNLPETLQEFDEFEKSLLPASKVYSAVTQEASQFAKETHVSMDDIKFKENKATGRSLTELTMEVSVNGDYNGIMEFLNRLQRSRTVYIVDGLGVEQQNAAPGQGAVGALKVSLHLRTYFRKA